MTIGRPRTFDLDEKIGLATGLFWAKGYEATSMQDLLNVTGLSKSSLYQAFGSKQKLFLKCLEHYGQFMASDLQRQLSESQTALAFLEGFFEMIVEEAQFEGEKKGCLITNTCNELCGQDVVISNAIGQISIKIANVLARAIEQGRVDGSIGAKSNTNDLVAFLMTNINGLRTMVKAGVSYGQLKPVKKILLDSLAKG